MPRLIPIILLSLLIGNCAQAQELLIPLSSRQSAPEVKSSDTLLLELPFFDDFSNYEGTPDHKRWLTFQAFVNRGYAPQPPSVGMVTLDALNEYGELYPNASTNLFTADTLASQIIRLDSLTGTYKRRFLPSDSIYLSFYYIPGGWYGNMWERVGDAPSMQDSLFLEFYSESEEQWNTVWATKGHNADTAGIASDWPWRYVCIKIDDSKYLTKHFQFRFRNYASLDPNPKAGISGNCDQWNIDYINLNYNRSLSDSLSRDIAFVEKAPSMLQRYQAMPARQFTSSDMAERIELTMVNRYSQTLASNYSYTVYNSNNQQIANYEGGYENIPTFYPSGRYQTIAGHSNPPVNFSFPAMSEASDYKIVHVVREGVGGDNHICNDTLIFDQKFDNYFAYDDGIPENGYGLTATGSHLWLASRFDLGIPDTLTAVDLYFNRTRNNENENILFQFCVWSCSDGKPETLLYRDEAKQKPEFDGMNQFHRYPLSEPQVISDSVFIGFEQLSVDFINLGFDRNTDSRQYLFYRTGNEWQQSILRGSIMMRPVFGEKALVSISDVPSQDRTIKIYPNPAHDQINIECDIDAHEQLTIMVYNMQGQTLIHQPYSPSLNVSTLRSGVYLLKITNANREQQALKKLIIRK